MHDSSIVVGLQVSSTNSTVDDDDDDECVDETIDAPWQNFLSPEFGTKSQREVA